MSVSIRRIGRWASNVVTGLSLLLCVAVVALWARSYWYYDQVRRTTERDDFYVNSYLGEVQMLAGLDVWPGEHNRRLCYRAYPTGWSSGFPPKAREYRTAKWHALGFGFHKVEHGGMNPKGGWIRGRRLYVPHWALAVCLAALPGLRLALIMWRARRRAWRRARNLCPVCGYDLRASPECCPECGTSNSAAAQSARPGDRVDDANGRDADRP
jgi:hypothetical protein